MTTPAGQPGWEAVFYDHDEKGEPLNAVARYDLYDTRVKLNDFVPPGLTPTWSIKLTGNLVVDTNGPFEFGLTVSGRAKLWIDDVLTIDNWTKQRPGDFFYGFGYYRNPKGCAILIVSSGKELWKKRLLST